MGLLASCWPKVTNVPASQRLQLLETTGHHSLAENLLEFSSPTDSELRLLSMIEYSVGWITLGLVNATLARLHGRSAFTYFLGSMLMGPLVTLLLASGEAAKDDKRGKPTVRKKIAEDMALTATYIGAASGMDG